MNILVTGATGYLGSHIVRLLLNRGDSVVALVRNKENLKRIEPLQNQVAIVSVGELVTRISELQIDAIIHTACAYARDGNTSEDVLNGNLLTPLRILELAVRNGVKRWINTGTCLPPLVDSYALTKNQFCQWGQLYAESERLQFINLQLEHFYGPNAPNSHFLVRVIEKLRKNEELRLTAGTQRRDFIYIADVLCVYDKVLDCSFAESYLDIPVGTGDAPSIREVVEYLKDCTCSSSELYFGAIPMRKNEPSSQCNIKKLKEIDAIPLVGWRDGMKQFLV